MKKYYLLVLASVVLLSPACHLLHKPPVTADKAVKVEKEKGYLAPTVSSELTEIEKKPVAEIELVSYFESLTGIEIDSDANIQLYDMLIQWLGVPHRLGGTDKNGIDCSALVKHIFSEVYNYDLNRSSYEMLRDVKTIRKQQLKEGDLVFFTTVRNRVSHVGIYLKDNKFVHASSSRGVIISSMEETYWQRTFHSAGRVKSFK